MIRLATHRSVLHLDLDTFFVSVERLRNSELNGKALIIGGKSDRGVVASCSYEARLYGVHSAMPIRMAKRLCPDVMIISGDMEAYSKYSHMVTDVIAEKAPVFEKASIDEFYVDLTGMDRFFGCYKWSAELRETVMRETGLPISTGLSANKMISKVATGEAKPNGQLQIQRGSETDFLDPMPVSKIPMAGPKTCQLLSNMGVQKVITLRNMPVELMQRILGQNGLLLWKRANGIDNSPVVPYTESKSMSAERTFDKDTIDVKWLKSLLSGLTEKLAFKLRKSKRLSSCVTVKLRYSNFDTVSKQLRIPYSSCDHVLIPRVMELFDKLFDRRMLIRLVGVRLSHLVYGDHQINLFDDTQEHIKLYQAMDLIRQRHGDRAVMRATGMGIVKNRPDINPFMKG